MNSEISGGLRNAMEKGESMESAKRTFINAGYPVEEVEYASQNLSINPVLSEFKKEIPSQMDELPEIPKKKSSALIIIPAVLILLILVGAALTGLYWDKIKEILLV